ncbi:MAG: UDP-N-acetylglucosamine 2-epimerase (hydrolyzing) [Candidatus Taylorbacteria bacterium CG11_big_fil_rev_8_21_14_0_20_46_11]|uniref:UDP-N-acetylglucosamine 2-epimerase (Hydrolyzing) n=1 Tax=Candidatus Taylorbacteria bacterium CG11_big_fil_rev_8_21_14_0_20_46_11 TaxID=1975025 RepID=A0A2H0KCP0_9BACT|nr:MAG: UDP-N-acetylglucosamine 2-epimerase (hydrolyzing) [Candidatus Taylorbacteria bacterium CG11_big_fil_rev_8_21_14_0_20_46_11]
MITSRKKIVYVTGTRADFGLMTSVLHVLETSQIISLQVYATGMHLMEQFGNTVELVMEEFPSAKSVDAFLKGDTLADTSRFVAEVLSKTTNVFEKDRPDLVLLLGDRPEMLAVATACLYLNIPTAHLHGGERTGTVDETARHAITKLASLHFPATQEASERIEKMGEDVWRIQVVGAPALDTIKEQLPSTSDVYTYINLRPSEKFVLLVQHPSDEAVSAGAEMKETISALNTIALPVIAVYPNSDTGSSEIIKALENERENPLLKLFKSIPYKMFLALEREAGVFVGNSSAAIIESASFKTPVVNIGERQRGRLRGGNVIDVPHERERIVEGVKKALYDQEYRDSLQTLTNPWGKGDTAERVRKTLENTDISTLLSRKQIVY